MSKDSYQIKLGKCIRHHREALGISQETFAEEVNLHRTYIGSIERGERNLSLRNIVKIAKALGIKPSELFEAAGF